MNYKQMIIITGLLVVLGLFNFVDITPAASVDAASLNADIITEENEVQTQSQIVSQLPTLIETDTDATQNIVLTFALPLKKEDYYWGKFENGSAGAKELNKIGTLIPGDRVEVIGDGYITLNKSAGYVQPRGHYYASGLCWSISAMGGMMDQVNKQFRVEYGMDLFIFKPGDRYGHSVNYSTYKPSNNGWGYTVSKIMDGVGQPDYKFQINPDVKNLPGFSDLELNMQLGSSSNTKGAYKGQMIYANLLANKQIL
jgi:hypothetical protein